jgi:hypothetical protein
MSQQEYDDLADVDEIRSYMKSIQKERGLTQRDVRQKCRREQSNNRCGFWDIVDCSNIPRLTSAINQIAKVEPKRPDAPQTAFAESFLNTIEETIDEAAVSDMFGAASGLLDPITPAGSGKRDEEEDDELEEISAVGGGAVEGFSGGQEEENEEKETLIREVGDYLFKMLGDDS